MSRQRGSPSPSAVRLACIAIVAAGLWLVPGVAHATYPGANGRIAYVSNAPSGEARELFTVDPDGTDVERLTDNALEEFGPAWSPDGDTLAFYVPDAGGRRAVIFTLASDGGDPQFVTRAGTAHPSPSFSKSGRRILFTTGTRLVTVRTDDGRGRRVLRSVRPRRAGAFTEPSFSPNGRWIVFAGAPSRGTKPGIWKIRHDGSRLRKLARVDRQRPVGEAAPDFSPNGRWIVFWRERSGPRLIRANGADNHRVAIPNGADYGSPSFSPTGDRLAINDVWPGNYLLPRCGDVFTVSTGGSDRHQVTHYSDGARSCPGGFQSPFVGAWDATWQPLPPGSP